MDDTTTKTSNDDKNKSRKRRLLTGAEEQRKRQDDDGWDDEEEEEQCDVELWHTLNKSVRHVQSVLDQNRALIQQANDNHQSGVPDNLARNVDLIREINSNISRVLSIYSDLSSSFSSIVHQRRAIKNDSNDDDDGNPELDRVKSQ